MRRFKFLCRPEFMLTLRGQTERFGHQIGPIGDLRVTSGLTAGGFNYRKGSISAPELIWPDHRSRFQIRAY